MTDILHWILIIVSIPLLVALVRHTMKRAKDLSQRIDDYKEEQEARKNQPGPVNPYENMGKLFGGGSEDEDRKSGG